MSLCVSACLFLWRPGEGLSSSGARVQGGWVVVMKSDHLKEQEALIGLEMFRDLIALPEELGLSSSKHVRSQPPIL